MVLYIYFTSVSKTKGYISRSEIAHRVLNSMWPSTFSNSVKLQQGKRQGKMWKSRGDLFLLVK